MPERSDEVLRQQVQLLYDNGTVVLFANLVGAGLVAVIVGPELAETVYPWCLAVAAVALGGGVVIWAYRRRGGDAGPGITADDIAKLTGDFGAADTALAHIREGTGFSLSVAKALVELEDGRFGLSSDGATGMSVTATFPPERVLTP